MPINAAKLAVTSGTLATGASVTVPANLSRTKITVKYWDGGSLTATTICAELSENYPSGTVINIYSREASLTMPMFCMTFNITGALTLKHVRAATTGYYNIIEETY